jgi:pimeloyl-ACP methyl ester carboxylesterase
VGTEGNSVRIHYVESIPRQPREQKGTILLIHGFPETSYQFRHVMQPLAQAGYHVIAPDTRGHGFSGKAFGEGHEQRDRFTKKCLAEDLHSLVRMQVGVRGKVHLVGHDIGGMIAHAYVSQWPDHVETVTWGECPLPGSSYYDKNRHAPGLWHFDFHSHHPALAASLVQGKERMYLMDFYERLSQNAQASFTTDVVNFYVDRYSMPDAMRCAMAAYGAFEKDAVHNREWRDEHGKIQVRNMLLIGERGVIEVGHANAMAREFYEDPVLGVVQDSGHYLAEENPEGFVKQLLRFIEA